MSEISAAQRLNDVINEKHLQKKIIANKVGVPPTTLQSWLTRKNDLPSSVLLPLADALGVSPLYLLTGYDELPPKIPDSYVDLDQDEHFLIRTYRALDREGQIVVANKAVEELRRAKSEQGSVPSVS